MLLECPKRCHGGALQSGTRDVPEEPPEGLFYNKNEKFVIARTGSALDDFIRNTA